MKPPGKGDTCCWQGESFRAEVARRNGDVMVVLFMHTDIQSSFASGKTSEALRGKNQQCKSAKK